MANVFQFQGEEHPLSHRFPVSINVSGTIFGSVEHGYRYFKAAAAHDTEQCDNIMTTQGISEYLELFASNSSLPKNQWDFVKWLVAYRLNYEKVSAIFYILVQNLLRNLPSRPSVYDPPSKFDPQSILGSLFFLKILNRQ